MEKLRICAVVGARPNFIKMAPLLEEMRHRPAFAPILVHTGQHFSPEMSDQFFRELSMPEPDLNLGVGGGTQTEQTAEIMRRIEPVLQDAAPCVVLVVGDVNSTMAAALVAAKLGLPVAHVEAGLRSFDRTMPEEINRIVTDALSDFLFVTEPSGRENLLAEGVPERKIFFTGNVMIDTLLRFRHKAAESDVIDRLGLQAGGYAVVTLHRPSNVDDPAQLSCLLEALNAVAAELPVVFPLHPRTRARIQAESLPTGDIVCVPPLGYLDFLHLMSEARLVLTDSGGIQEETTILQVPCLTLRENTERPVTIERGSNSLVGTQPAAILKAVRAVLDDSAKARPARMPDLWDGRASVRIMDILAAAFQDGRHRVLSPAAETVPTQA
jgi:UDP-N-acetylglucosamine 2-epimerase (non-hydrolysing)